MLRSDPTHQAAVAASERARVATLAHAEGYTAPPTWFRPPRGASAGSVATSDAALYALMAASVVAFAWVWWRAGAPRERVAGTYDTGLDVLGAV